ncbi:MAG: hypothetical protein ACR2KX_17295 [Chitinophagaceae bacterium]
MKKSLLSILLAFIFLITWSQEREKEPHYNYLSVGTCVYTNAPGSFNEKVFMTTEFGRTFGIFDIGVMAGRLNLMHSDTNWFIEVLPTINVFSKGRFSEALTLGAGYVFGAKENFLTEITNSINFAPTNRLVITSKAQFMGLSVTFNFIKKNSTTDILKRKSLLN